MKKVVFIGLAVIMVAVIALLVLAPGGSGSDNATDPPSYLEALGGLVPQQDVRSGELARASCFDQGSQELIIPAGGGCQAALPSDATRLTVCLVEGTLSRLRIQGRDYGPQDADLDQLSCDVGQRLPLYDKGSILIMVCLPLGPQCRVHVR